MFGKYFRFKSIQSNIAVAFSCLIVIILVVMAFLAYKFSTDSVEENSREYTYQLVEQVNLNIESYIKYMENISEMVLYNYDVREYLSGDTVMDEYQKNDMEQKISDQFKAIINAREDIASIMVFGYKNDRFISDRRYLKLNTFNDPKDQWWYKKAIEANGEAVVSSSHVQNIVEDEYRWVVSLSRELSSDNGKNKLGIFLVDLNYRIINNICNQVKLGKTGYIYILDSTGNIVYHPQQQLIYSNIKKEMVDKVIKTKTGSFIVWDNGRRKMYTVKQAKYSDWRIVGVSCVDELVSNKKEMQIYFLFGGIGFLLIAIALSIFISSRISKPIKILKDSMKEVQNGNFDIKVGVESLNEIGALSRAFNLMTVKIKELINQNAKDQELKRKSELKALQAQINPHFLYNTLDSIIWMAESKNSKEVVLMASALAKLFRLSISKGKEIVPIFTEVEHVKNYLTIQKMRYKDKIDYQIEIENEILNYKILKIILQPLVENCIYHGIKNMMEIGIIKIYGKKVEDKIFLQVIDNGIGMSKEDVDNIFTKKESLSVNKGNAVGVRNVNERIKLYFGEEYGLAYESELDVGTTVNIWIPILE